MSSWWNKKYGKDAKCAISFQRLRPGKKNGVNKIITLSCKHSFYREPLKSWVLKRTRMSSSCPLCRKELSADEIHRLRANEN